MKDLKAYLDAIENYEQRVRMEAIFNWILEKYPNLKVEIKWNQPLFIDHGTLIIAFSRAKNHMSFTPEVYSINIFSKDIKTAGYEHTKGLVRIKWTDKIDFDLLAKIIEFNIMDKAECHTFFRK